MGGVMPRKELTQQQENFLQKYIECGIAYQAYIYAYPKAKNWTRNAVDVQANKLLNNNKVNLRLAEYNKKVESTLEQSTTLNKRRILNEIIELQQQCKEAGQGQAGINLQALKLLSQIAGLLSEQPQVQVNIQNNTVVGEVTDYLNL